MKSNPRLWRWFFVLAALEAGAAFVALLAVPHEAGGYSVVRLGMLLILAAMALAELFGAARLARHSPRWAGLRYGLASFGLVVVVSTILFLLRYLEPQRLLPYYERLSPLLWYLLAVSAEFGLFWLIDVYRLRPAALSDEMGTWRAAAVAFAVLLLGFGFVAITRIGLTPDSAYWGEPGAPVLPWQFAVALVCAVCVLLAGLKWKAVRRGPWVGALVIWLLAVLVWSSVPMAVMKNSFYAPMNPPTNQPFPNSDAGYYDSMAQSLLIGYPYQGDIPTRPLYITFLAFLHLLAGQSYQWIIFGQTLLLALIPVLLYLLGSKLHGKVAGVLAAFFAIFREWNSLLIASQTRVSNTRTLLVDLPTLLLMLLACLFAVRWLQRRGRYDALLAGGSLGVLLLLRTQSLVILPFVVLLAVAALGLKKGGLGTALLLFVAGFIAAVVPWLVHNYLQSGQLTLDAPFEYQVIASQYKYTGNLDLGSVDLTGKSVFGILLTFALKDPGFVAWFISTHFLATLIDSLAVLPLAAPFNGLLAPLNLYWMDWTANLNPVNIGLLVLYLVVIAVGLGAAWRRLRWAGLVPLAFALGYALANGIGRFSGWRYDLPADWIGYFYFAVGLAEILAVLSKLFGARASDGGASWENDERRWNWRWAAATLAGFALIGALPWLAEGLAPPRYADQTLSVLADRLGNSKAVQSLNVNAASVQSFVADPQATLQIGRVLYPRFFIRGDGLSSSHPWPAYAPQDYPRMGFLLLNQSRHDAVISMKQPASGFQQGADAIILGCQRKDYIEVRLVLFPATGLAYASAPLAQGCK